MSKWNLSLPRICGFRFSLGLCEPLFHAFSLASCVCVVHWFVLPFHVASTLCIWWIISVLSSGKCGPAHPRLKIVIFWKVFMIRWRYGVCKCFIADAEKKMKKKNSKVSFLWCEKWIFVQRKINFCNRIHYFNIVTLRELIFSSCHNIRCFWSSIEIHRSFHCTAILWMEERSMKWASNDANAQSVMALFCTLVFCSKRNAAWIIKWDWRWKRISFHIHRHGIEFLFFLWPRLSFRL